MTTNRKRQVLSMGLAAVVWVAIAAGVFFGMGALVGAVWPDTKAPQTRPLPAPPLAPGGMVV